jgi:hypothetical protein
MKHYAIVGMKHRGAEGFVCTLPETEPLDLVREPANRFDRFAVQVHARGRHVGFVAANQNQALAEFMDARQQTFPLGHEQARLPAKLHWSRHGYPMVAVMEMNE